MIKFISTPLLLIALISSTIAMAADPAWHRSPILPPDDGLIDVASNDNITVAITNDGVILSSTDHVIWTERLSTKDIYEWYPQYELEDIVWSGTQFVAVGDAILTSPDGIDWTEQPSSTTAILRAIAWNGSSFVSVGDSGTILSSSDGVTWAPQASNTTATIASIIWSGSNFIAVGDGGLILSSTDGATWGQPTSNTTNNIFDITWNGTTLLALELDGTLLSTDGQTWSRQATSTQFDKVSSDGTLFYANSGYVLSRDPVTTATSTDGISWTQQNSFPDGTIEWDGYRLFSLGSSVQSSNDGITWTAHTADSDLADSYDIAWGNGMFVSISRLKKSLYSSPDGVGWALAYSSDYSIEFQAIDFVNGNFVAMGVEDYFDGAVVTTGMVALISSDGVTWQKNAVSIFSQNYTAIAGANGTYVAVGWGSGTYNWVNVISSSDDTVSWRTPSSTTRALWDATYANGIFVAVGDDGVILNSTDGVNWQGDRLYDQRDTFSNTVTYIGGPTADSQLLLEPRPSLSRVEWVNDQFVAMDSSDEILTSPDGITWTQQPAGTAHPHIIDHDYVSNGTVALRSYRGGIIFADATTLPVEITTSTNPSPTPDPDPTTDPAPEAESSGGGGGALNGWALLALLFLTAVSQRQRIYRKGQ